MDKDYLQMGTNLNHSLERVKLPSMESPPYPRLVFQVPLDDRTAFEIEQKGWCGIAAVELANGQQVPVFFYDPERLVQDLESEIKSGKACIAEPGMIVIPEVTISNMEKAVKQLSQGGYFSCFASSSSST